MYLQNRDLGQCVHAYTIGNQYKNTKRSWKISFLFFFFYKKSWSNSLNKTFTLAESSKMLAKTQKQNLYFLDEKLYKLYVNINFLEIWFSRVYFLKHKKFISTHSIIMLNILGKKIIFFSANILKNNLFRENYLLFYDGLCFRKEIRVC